MNTPGYEQLAAVLQAAYDQAAKGKGAERHADSKPFHEQPMQTGSDLLGTDAGLAFQAIKKIREGSTFTEFDRFERELLGAINYIAGMIIWRRRQLLNPFDWGNDGEHYAETQDPFAGAPEWARFKAQDKNGIWWWYDAAPGQAENTWVSEGNNSAPATDKTTAPNPNWRDTLIERTSG